MESMKNNRLPENEDLRRYFSENTENVKFEDLFNLKDIQRIQDDFSGATGVASIITRVDGTPITRPSNFCHLCIDIIRNTERGYANCCKSDAAIGAFRADGPVVQTCLSGGLWDAGAGIAIGGRHIANWLIGQVRDETQTEAKMLEYAREIRADEQAFLTAFNQVPSMSREKFEMIAKALYTLANQLSTIAFQNVQMHGFIAERKMAEEALREANEHLELKVEERTQEIVALNEELTAQNEEITAVNEELTAQNEEITAMNEELATLNQSLEGINDVLETRVAERTADLTATHEELSAQFDELVQAQKDLFASEEMLSNVFQASYDGIAVVRQEDGLFYSVNQSYCCMTGHEKDELIGKTVEDINLWVDPGQRRKLIGLLQEHGVARFEIKIRRKDKTERTWDGSWQRIEINGVWSIVSIATDITDRKLIEAENVANIQRMNRLERLSSLGTLAAGVAHEINQPLQALKVTADGMCYWLEQGKCLDQEQAKSDCNRISRSAERISSIVKRLRDFVNRSRSADMEAVNLNEVEKSVLDLLEHRIKSHSISLREELSQEQPIVWGNSTRLEEIYINFLVNAIQALDSVDQADKEIVITTDCKNDKVVLEISNNGPFIPQEVIAKIFDPFFSTKSTNGENMGLGLSIIQSIVSEHGGHISAVNHDKGVSFRIEFPKHRSEGEKP